MRRLMELLSGPLTSWPAMLTYGGYADWVGARVRVELVRAHAQCALFSSPSTTSGRHSAAGAGGGRGGGGRGDAELCAAVVAKAHAPHAPLLLALWCSLLQVRPRPAGGGGP